MHRRALLVLGVMLAAVLLPLSASGDNANPTALAQQAAAAYDAKEYGQAADAYAVLTRQMGVQDADVWYNAGNAFARAGLRGAAIGAYRRALELAPRHADAQHNLALVRGQVSEDEPQGATAFMEWLLTPARLIPLRWWRNALWATWVLLWLLTTVKLIRPGFSRSIIALSAVLCVAVAGGWAANLLARSLESRAIVVTENAPLRTGPGPDYLATHALPDGTECRLQARQAGWVQLQLSDGSTGWLEADRVLMLPLGDPVPEHGPAPMSDAT